MAINNIETVKTKIDVIRNGLHEVIIGNDETIDMVLTTLLAGGHVLLEDTPGTGKTTLAKALAKIVDVDFSRIQFTPDLLPADITGLNIFSQKEEKFTFIEGPIMTNILLADEINRATPRTQSALLEAMQEGQVTVDGESRALNNPFFVIATQNPIETAGTFPLPEAQLDRFTMQLSMGFPTPEQEEQLLIRFGSDNPLDRIETRISAQDIIEMKGMVRDVEIHPELVRYIVAITQATRNNSSIQIGASPRASISMQNAVKAYALLNGRDYVVPEDIKTLVVPVLAHRLLFHSVSSYQEKANILTGLISHITVPSEDFNIK